MPPGRHAPPACMSIDAITDSLAQATTGLLGAFDHAALALASALPHTVLGVLLVPPALPLLVAALGLLLLPAFPGAGRLLAWLGLIAAWLLSSGVGASQMAAWAEGESLRAQSADSLRAALARPDAPQAIVIIGGGSRHDGRERPEPDFLKPGTLQRVFYGAWVAIVTGLPVLVSGGSPEPGRSSEAALMKRALEESLDTPVRWLEGASADTAENARLSAELLRDAGVSRIVLVTEAYHMPRAREAFERAGLAVLPAPCAFAGGPADFSGAQLLPSGEAAFLTYRAAHELLGRLWYRLRDQRPDEAKGAKGAQGRARSIWAAA